MYSESPISTEVRAIYEELAKRLTVSIGKPVAVLEKSEPAIKLDDETPRTERHAITLMCDGIDLRHGCNVSVYNAAPQNRWSHKQPDPVWKLEINTCNNQDGRRSFPELKAGGYNWDNVCQRVRAYFSEEHWAREKSRNLAATRAILDNAEMGKWKLTGNGSLSGHVRLENTIDLTKPIRLSVKLDVSGNTQDINRILNGLIDAGLIDLE